jgi:dipeptidyl aminopeptidase/acylaminoacyl peptidase
LAAVPWGKEGADFSRRVQTSAALDRAVSSFVLAPDSREVWFTAEDEGGENVYAVALTGGAVRTVAAPARGVYTGLSVGKVRGAPLLATYESASAPGEPVRLDTAKGTHTPLSAFNAAKLAELDLPPLEEFWFTSQRGARIHNFIVRPPGFDPTRKYPLFVMIHGGPHTMWRDQFFLRWNYHLLASRGIVLLLTNYTGSTGFGEAFAQGIQGDPLIGPGLEVNEAATAAIAKYPFIDGTRQCAGGASYGGHLANWLQASTTHYRCLVSHAGLVNLEAQWGTSDTIYGREVNMGGPHWEGNPGWQEQNPIKYANRFRTPVLVTIGEQDFRVPLNNSLEYWSALQRMQVPSKLLVFPEENHWILKGENSRFWYAEVQDWLAKYLLP